MKPLSPALKGLITGAVMILISIFIFRLKGNFENDFQYITYSIYFLGILWTIMDYKPATAEESKFKNYFGQGFRCFIIVTLLMVIFTYIFLKFNPQMKTDMAANYQAGLEKSKDLTPAEIAAMVKQSKDFFVPRMLSATVFGYLLIGSLLTILTTLFLRKRIVEKNI